MRIGAMSFVTDQTFPPATLARMVEAAGLDSLWVPEKTHVPLSRETPWPGGELPEHYRRCFDPFVALSVAAAVTERIRIGTGVCLATLHDPIVLAKSVASLDQVSGGRFDFGVGYGWNAEELAGHGVAIAEAPGILIDKLGLMSTLWTEPERGYAGPHCRVDPCSARPRPAQQPRPPVYFGGVASDRVFRDVIAHGDGWMPIEGFGWTVDDVHRLRAQAEKANHKPNSLKIIVYSATPNAANTHAYAEAGVDEIVYALPPVADGTVEARLGEVSELATNTHRSGA